MTLRIAGPAQRDITFALTWSGDTFGAAARTRYERLIARALLAITATDPLGSRDAPEIGTGVRLYHLRGSRRDGDDRPAVASPRHFLVYRREDGDVVVLLRLLHDASDLPSRFTESG